MVTIYQNLRQTQKSKVNFTKCPLSAIQRFEHHSTIVTTAITLPLQCSAPGRGGRRFFSAKKLPCGSRECKVIMQNEGSDYWQKWLDVGLYTDRIGDWPSVAWVIRRLYVFILALHQTDYSSSCIPFLRKRKKLRQNIKNTSGFETKTLNMTTYDKPSKTTV